MAEIIDILMPRFNDTPYFTVDVSAASGYVAVTPGGGPFGIWGVAGQQSLFSKRDNIRLLTAGFYIPESFTNADWYSKKWSEVPSNALQLTVYNLAGKQVAFMPGFGSSSNGTFALPFPNYEHALDLFCDFANLTGSTYQITGDQYFLTGAVYCNNISMVGVPAALDGKVIKVTPFIKILHTIPLIVNPNVIEATTLTRSGGTATFTNILGHPFTNGQTVRISGAVQPEYNVTTAITVVNPTTFTYAVGGTPVTPATGSIIAEPA